MEFDELVTLEEVTTKIGDGLHGTPKYDENGTYYFINGNNLSNGNIIFKETTKKVNEDEFKKYQKPLNDRTLFVSINGTIGNTAVYNNEDIILGKSACYLNVKNSIDRDFIYYLLNNNHFQNYIDQYATGTTIKNVSLKTIRGYKFELPSIKKQKSISIILKNIDKKIQVNQQIIANLEELSQTLFKRWFVDFEFPDKEGNPYKFSGGVMKDSELGKIPVSWSIRNINEISNINKENITKNMKFNYINYLDTGSIANNSIKDIKYIDLATEKLPSRAKRIVKNNDIVFSTVRPNQRHFGFLTNLAENMVVSTGFAVISCEISDFKEILYTWITQDKIINQLQTLAEHSTSTYPSISPKDIGNIKIIVPFEDDLAKISQNFKYYYNEIAILHKENNHLAELRDILLPKLMSGEIELPDELEVDEHAELLQ